MSQILDEVSKTTIQLLLKEPFYGHFFTGILREVSEKVNTAAVGMVHSQMVKLYINEKFWTEALTTPDFRYGVLKHEILHIVLKHILITKDFSNHQLFNIAADIVVNQYIERHQLIEGVVLLELFSDLNMEVHKDVKYYYDILYKVWQNYQQKISTSTTPKANNSCESGNSTSNSSNNNKKHQQPPRASSNHPQNSQQSNLTPSEKALRDYMQGDNSHLGQHDLWWDEIGKMSAAERKILEGYINDVLKNTVNRVKNRSALPAGLQQYIDLTLKSLEPQVNWRRVLRIFAASSTRTYLKNTIRRPSKRYGTTPGIKVKNRQKLLVAIDTSGSVNNDELRVFFSELYHIWRQGAEIFVVECDAAIHNKYLYRGTPPDHISGRGGTDFNAPIEYANTEYQPDAIVYFTDGYAPIPTIKNRNPILWMITAAGLKEGQGVWDGLPGRKVKMT
ncbi:MAG: VWA-like domain-containing protein [Chitinophagales bacterium]